MTTAYLICGPESSGNRLLASILCRSGCGGEGSTNQPAAIEDLPDADDGPYALISHGPLSPWIAALRSRGFSHVAAIVVVREPIANCKSMLTHRHQTDFDYSYAHRTHTLVRNIIDGSSLCDQLEIITYEGLSELFLRDWLPRIGLPYVAGKLQLAGQMGPVSIRNQNAKHYDALTLLRK